jgi:hypothetical protein
MKIETMRDFRQEVILQLEVQGDMTTLDAETLLEVNEEIFLDGYFSGDVAENIASKILQGY